MCVCVCVCVCKWVGERGERIKLIICRYEQHMQTHAHTHTHTHRIKLKFDASQKTIIEKKNSMKAW